MRLNNLLIFDEIITAAGVTWYTPSHLDAMLGKGDIPCFQLTTSLVAGTSPTLTFSIEHSADAKNYLLRGNATFSITEGGAYAWNTNESSILLAYVRCSIVLGGTAPRARVKVFAGAHDL